MKKRIIATCLMLFVFTGSVAAVNAYKKSITVEYGISLNINGTSPKLTDASGAPVQAFTYNGTTYVPARAVADHLGSDVYFTEYDNTVNIYNDATNILHIAHILSNTATDCALLLSIETSDLISGNIMDHTAFHNSNQLNIDRNWTILENMTQENTYSSWVMSEGTLADDYSKLLLSYIKAHQEFERFRASRSGEAALKFADYYEEFNTQYYAFRESVDLLFRDVDWQDPRS